VSATLFSSDRSFVTGRLAGGLIAAPPPVGAG